jgi:hypothetical protein
VDKQPFRLRYGGRKSAKFVRCYWKQEMNVYRVEVELHPRVLYQHDIGAVQDLPKAARAIYPNHLHFAEINWKKLRAYLAKRDGKTWEAIFEGAVKRAKSMRRVTQYLRRQRIPNVHRFLAPLAINAKVRQALETWALQFEKECEQEAVIVLDTKSQREESWADTK